MTQKHFYTKIADVASIKLSLAELEISDKERDHLERLIEASLHATILELILSELSEEDKKSFLEHIAEDDQEKIWQLLSENISDVENKIKNAADELALELTDDIRTIR